MVQLVKLLMEIPPEEILALLVEISSCLLFSKVLVADEALVETKFSKTRQRSLILEVVLSPVIILLATSHFLEIQSSKNPSATAFVRHPPCLFRVRMSLPALTNNVAEVRRKLCPV